MIVSASRRTDIPAFYAPWLLRRLEEGHVLSQNPRRHGQLRRVPLRPDAVAAMVFWTKNPVPMLALTELWRKLSGFVLAVQYTLTPYADSGLSGLEPGLPPLAERLDALKALADRLGPEALVWRYDPVIVTPGMPPSWHEERFAALCAVVRPYVGRCVFSFFDEYRHLRNFRRPEEQDRHRLARAFAAVAAEHRLPLAACAEDMDMRPYGIEPSACIGPWLETLCGRVLPRAKDNGQRARCGCLASVDIGMYNTCAHGCAYCYAVNSQAALARNRAAHDPASPLLVGRPTGEEQVTDMTPRPAQLTF